MPFEPLDPAALGTHFESAPAEERWSRAWHDSGIFRFDEGSPEPSYAIDTPPPTVSGSLHVGHVFSYTQTDVVARHRRMRGLNVFYLLLDDPEVYGQPANPQLPQKNMVPGYGWSIGSAIMLFLSSLIALRMRGTKRRSSISRVNSGAIDSSSSSVTTTILPSSVW